MNIPFPVLTPPMVDPSWFNSGTATLYDEEVELAGLENKYKTWLNSIGEKLQKKTNIGKNYVERRVEENAEEDEEGNEDTEESEETQDEDEEDERPTTYSPVHGNDSPGNNSPENMGADLSRLWPSI